MKRISNIIFWIAIFLVIGVVFLLASGHEWLTIPLVKQPFFPLGTLLTWSLWILLPVLIGGRLGVKRFRFSWIGWIFVLLNLVALLLGLAWGGIGYWLSGNWAFHFENSAASDRFWNLNQVLIVINLLTLFFRFVFLVFQTKPKPKPMSTENNIEI